MEPVKTYKYKKVMVIDDSEIDRYIAEQVIRRSNFAQEVVIQESPVEALNILRAITDPGDVPGLVFVDIRMPEMEGFEFLEKFEELSDVIKNNCRIAIISSSADANDHKKAYANKYVRCFIDKPISMDTIAKNYADL
jgi:CheY-like chemotaxis protein